MTTSDGTPAAAPPTRIDVLGAPCFAAGLGEAADAVVERALSGRGGHVVQCNVHVLMSAQSDDALMRSLRDAWGVMPDGAPVAWLARRLGAHGARRIGGPDLMAAVVERGASRGVRHFFFGSTPGVLDGLSAHMRSTFPHMQLVGAVAPPFGAEHEPELLASINEAAPHVVWVGLGAPKQELWMLKHAPALAPALVVGVGAAFDFHAGTKERAPRWMQRAGLEWLHRLGSEPRRLARRYAVTNSSFLLHASRELVARRGADRRPAHSR